MKSSSCGSAIRQFYKTTTLHGFKYLSSSYYYDRVCWVACCFASACCAGVLCAVLWARFLQVPALLTLHDHHIKVHLPLVAVCPTADTVTHLLQQRMSADLNKTKRLPTILDHVLKRKLPSQEQLEILDDILFDNDLTLQETLMLALPSCEKIVLNCRLQSNIMACEKLFEKELTEWGACCVMRPEKYVGHDIEHGYEPYFITLFHKFKKEMHPSAWNSKKIDSLISKEVINWISQFNVQIIPVETDARYSGEEWVEPIPLTSGYNYIAQMSFISIEDKDSDKLIDDTCISSQGYTRRECLLKCREKLCGCADPMQRQKNVVNDLPTCQVLQLKCLRTFTVHDNNTCKCLPPCIKMTTYLSLESSLMDAINETNDKIYKGLNISTSSVLRLAITINGSGVFVVNPTETWITLMSSLGGVFNMFLGVGLFSALEVLFLVFVKLPIAIRKSTEMNTAVGH